MADGGHGDISKADLLTSDERTQSVVISDPSRADLPIIYVSEEFQHQTGYPPEEVLGRNCRFLQGPETDPRAVTAIRNAIKNRYEITIDILNYRKDGTEFWNRLHIRPLYDAQDKVLYFAGVQSPIDERDVRFTEFPVHAR